MGEYPNWMSEAEITGLEIAGQQREAAATESKRLAGLDAENAALKEQVAEARNYIRALDVRQALTESVAEQAQAEVGRLRELLTWGANWAEGTNLYLKASGEQPIPELDQWIGDAKAALAPAASEPCANDATHGERIDWCHANCPCYRCEMIRGIVASDEADTHGTRVQRQEELAP